MSEAHEPAALQATSDNMEVDHDGPTIASELDLEAFSSLPVQGSAAA